MRVCENQMCEFYDYETDLRTIKVFLKGSMYKTKMISNHLFVNSYRKTEFYLCDVCYAASKLLR